MGSGYLKQKKQARMMQEQLTKMQGDLETLEVTGSAGNGLVTITLSGKHELKEIKIKPECVDPQDVEGLQDLIRSAYTSAFKELESKMNRMPKLF